MNASTASSDLHFLQHAVRIGARVQGRTWPNPAVGCVLVKDGAVIATGNDDNGRPHAETVALAAAGGMARGTTAYVSLEPCAHTGKTPPCAEALIQAGVARVVIGATDPDPRVNGKGVALLKQAGIAVEELPIPEAFKLGRGFFRRVHHGLPYVAMKLATSMDGYMARRDTAEPWITGPAARRHAHGVRARMDAVLTGIGTVLADDPLLTPRNPGAGNPRLVRIVADRNLRLPLESKLVRTAAQQPTWVITSAKAVEYAASHATELREKGVVIIAIEDEELAPLAILKALAAQGITRVLVECGPLLATNFLRASCVDTLYWYRAPILLGSTGAAAIGALDTWLGSGKPARETANLTLAPDQCGIYEMDSCLPD